MHRPACLTLTCHTACIFLPFLAPASGAHTHPPSYPPTAQATQISPWVVPLDALEPYRCDAPPQEPAVLPYLRQPLRYTWDMQLSVGITPAEADGAPATTVTTTNLKYL